MSTLGLDSTRSVMFTICRSLVPVMELIERGRVRMSKMVGVCNQGTCSAATPHGPPYASPTLYRISTPLDTSVLALLLIKPPPNPIARRARLVSGMLVLTL
jgi:hypothetical protein